MGGESVPNPEGVDPATIYRWFHEGGGAKVTEPVRTTWDSVADRYIAVQDLVAEALHEAGAAFDGEAASAMQLRMSPLVSYASVARQAAVITSEAIDRQGQAFVDTRNQVQEPQPLPAQPGLSTDVVPIIEYAEAVEGYRAVTEQNQRAYSVYGDQTTGNTGALATFPPPEPVGLDLSAPTTTATQVAGGDPGGGRFSAGAGQYVPGGTNPGPVGGPGVGAPGMGAPSGGNAPSPGPGAGARPPGSGSLPPAAPSSPGTGGIAPAPAGGGVRPGGPSGTRWRQTVSPGLFGNSNQPGAAGSGGRTSGGGGSQPATERGFGTRGGAPGGGAPGNGSPGATSGLRGSPSSFGAGPPGAAGAPGGAPMTGGSRRGEEDQERSTKYIEHTDVHWGPDGMVVPPVIGADEEVAEPSVPPPAAPSPSVTYRPGMTIPGQ